jgi:hypothetical protein
VKRDSKSSPNGAYGVKTTFEGFIGAKNCAVQKEGFFK